MTKNYRAGGREGRPRGRDEWRTPPDLYSTLDEEFGFQLDAACTVENCLAPRGIYRDRGMDAFEEAWCPGPVWLNPPYSGQGGVRPWLEMAVVYSDLHPVVCLVSSDTSTRWWYAVVAAHAAEVRLVVGRLRFLRPDGEEHYTKRRGGGVTTPSAVVVFAPHRGEARYSYIDRRGNPLLY